MKVYERDYLLTRKKGVSGNRCEICLFLQDQKLSKFCFIHVDCDVSTSAREVFDILVEGDFIADTAFLVFDDYYLSDSYAETIQELLRGLADRWTIEDFSRTHLTRTVKLLKMGFD